MPGLVNAHDHLTLNHYPRTQYRECYDNAHQWGEDVQAHHDDEPIRSLRQAPLWERCFIGGLKNLLSGVTHVIHHDPLHRPFRRDWFPVNVLLRYGWAHSLHFSSEAQIVASHHNRPTPDTPWFIHVAEGTDEMAAREYHRLCELGVVDEHAVLIHGVGLTDTDIAHAAPLVRGLVWCPTTNDYLLDAQPPIEKWLAAGGTVLLGSDSRLTASGDLLAEIQRARTYLPERAWLPIRQRLTVSGHPLFCSSDAQNWIALPDDLDWPARRTDVACITVKGIPRVGTVDLMRRLLPEHRLVPGKIDGSPRMFHISLAKRIQRCTLKEPGVILLR